MHRFGPPPGLTQASTWTGIDHSVSGLWPATRWSPCSDSLSLRLRHGLSLATDHNSLAHYAKGTRSPLGLHPQAPTAFRRRVSGSLSLPYSGCFSPFPHGTGSLSVSGEYLALDDGPPSFTQGSTCPKLLRSPPGFVEAFDDRALTFYGRPLQTVCLARRVPNCGGPTTPAGAPAGLGSSPFARRY